MSTACPSDLPRRAFQWDLARQLERLDVLLKLLPRYADWGYQELYLHLEDAVDYPSVPGIARKEAFTHRQLGRLVDAASRVGIEVVPIVNLLGHTQYLIKHQDLRDLNELRDPAGDPLTQGQICPLHPRFPDVARRLIQDTAPFCTAGKLHAGLDESFHLGKCPRCRAEVEKHGLAYHFSEHVRRVHQIVTARGLRMAMWADMLTFVPEAIERLPSDIVAYDWYYYPFRRLPRVELFNFAEVDLATPLKRRGLEYWGCPMSGAFRWEPMPIFSDRLANIRSWWTRVRAVGGAGMLVSAWEPYRLALEVNTVVDAAAASLWLDGEALSNQQMMERGFRRVFGSRGAASGARAALQADAYPFSGYARWEINERWDLRAGASAENEAASEKRHFERLARGAASAAPAWRTTLRFRAYLADREAWIARSGETLLSVRRALAENKSALARRLLNQLQEQIRGFAVALRAGKSAAAAMWRRTRNPRWTSPNAEMLARDAARLATFRRELAAIRRNPARVWEHTVLCGAWQLVFTVENFAPALQRISVEQQERSGSWRELHGRHTIEFQAAAAKPRATVRRPFSVPVEPDADAGIGPVVFPLRIVLRGLGPVRIRNVELTDGVSRFHLATRHLLGKAASTAGLPPLGEVQDVWTPPLPARRLRGTKKRLLRRRRSQPNTTQKN